MMVTITCLGMADGVLPNLAAEGIQHGVASTSTRAVAAAMEKQDTLEKTAAEVESAVAAACTADAIRGRMGGRR
jgi:hypothetical protein